MLTPMSDRRRKLVVLATMLGSFLAAVDVTVVGTAMPTIIGTLGGISLYSWVFSAYLVTSTTTVPIYGKLADLYGRRPVYVTAVILFLLGSALCGFSRNMEQLIAFRAIQGLGAGAVVPLGMTIIGDLFPLQERARVQGLFGAVWGVSSVSGPALGGIIVDSYGWPWVFYINLPLGLLSIGLLWFSLRESFVRTRQPSIDFRGVALLTVGVVAFLFALLEGGANLPANLPQLLGLLGFAIVVLVIFAVHETRVGEPIMPLTFFLNSRIFWSSSAAAFIVSMAMMSASSYIPLFAQGVMGGTATAAGLVLAPLSVGWPLAASFSGHLILRFGYRRVAILGTLLVLAGALLLTMLRHDSSQAYAVAVTFTIGLGLGFSMSTYLLAVQNSVGWSQRGIATSMVQFSRTMGSAVGVAVLGAVLNAQMVARLSGFATSSDGAAAGLSRASVLLDPATRAGLDVATLTTLRLTLAGSLNVVFWGVAVFAVLAIAATLLMPRGRGHEESAEQAKASYAEMDDSFEGGSR